MNVTDGERLLRYARETIAGHAPLPSNRPPIIFTIGHGTRSLSELRRILVGFGVDLVIDVRWHPFSRSNPKMRREVLAAQFAVRPKYVYAGKYLGNPEDHGLPPVAQDAYAKAFAFLIAKARHNHRIVLLCSEAEPANCHRHLRLAVDLDRKGCVVYHIDPAGVARALRPYADVAREAEALAGFG
jgi:hypothetical protein